MLKNAEKCRKRALKNVEKCWKRVLKNVDKITLKNVENVGESLFILEHIKDKYLFRQKKSL